MAKKDKERVRLLLKQTASIRTIQRAIRKFREKKWERKLLMLDPTIFKVRQTDMMWHCPYHHRTRTRDNQPTTSESSSSMATTTTRPPHPSSSPVA